MADKMKKQQEESRARLAKQREQSAESKKKAAPATATEPVEKRLTRVSSRQTEGTPAENPKTNAQSTRKSKKGEDSKKAAASTNNISNYFKKAEVNVPEDNPTVQEALEHAADEYEANPTALGERQDLVATEQPELVSGGYMRQYQLEGLEWLKSLYMNGLCGILADEMGLGKTVQAISLIAFFKEKNISGPFLICAPLSTVSNWIDEFARWTPGIKTVLYHGPKNERAATRRESMRIQDQKSKDFPVVCTSYEICMNDRKFLGQYQWKYIIVVRSLAVF